MSKLVKGLLLGAAVGAGVKAFQEVRGEGDIDQVGASVAKAAAEGAAVGVVVGWVLDRRDRRRMTKMQKLKAKAGIGSVVAGAGALAESALPVIQQAAETARKRATEAAEAAKPHVVHAAEVARERADEAAKAARPHVVHAADVAKEKAVKAADAARPKVETAADLAKVRAQRAADSAKAKLAEYDLPVVVAV